MSSLLTCSQFINFFKYALTHLNYRITEEHKKISSFFPQELDKAEGFAPELTTADPNFAKIFNIYCKGIITGRCSKLEVIAKAFSSLAVYQVLTD